MSFTVCYAGQEKDFSSKDHAIAFMDHHLDCGSIMWIANYLILRTRTKLDDGSFKTTEFNYDSGKPVGVVV